MILEARIILKFSSDASASPVCSGGTYQQIAINCLCFPCSGLACYCAIAVLCCIAVLLLYFLNNMSCYGDAIQYDQTVKPVIPHKRSSCCIYDSARGKKVTWEWKVKGLSPALLLHQLHAGTIKFRCSRMES